MAATAVGLFVSSSVAEAVVDALRAHGMPSRGIRTIGQAANFPMPTVASTPGNDSFAGLARDLRSMGATDHEIEAYLDGVRRGNVLVLSTGTLQQADAASAIMNQFTALEVEEYTNASGAIRPEGHDGIHAGLSDGRAGNFKADRMQARGDGAKLFSW
jgi:hypothetical protein